MPRARRKVSANPDSPPGVHGALPQKGGQSKRSLTPGAVSAHFRGRTQEARNPAQPTATAASSPRVPSVSVRRLSSASPDPLAVAKHHRRPSTKQAGRNPDGTVKPHRRSEVLAKRIEELLALGWDINQVAIEMDLRPGQIRTYYEKEVQLAEARANGLVARALHTKAVSGDVPAAVFWLKSRGGEKWNPDRKRGLEGLGSLIDLLANLDQPRTVDGEVLSTESA